MDSPTDRDDPARDATFSGGTAPPSDAMTMPATTRDDPSVEPVSRPARLPIGTEGVLLVAVAAPATMGAWAFGVAGHAPPIWAIALLAAATILFAAAAALVARRPRLARGFGGAAVFAAAAPLGPPLAGAPAGMLLLLVGVLLSLHLLLEDRPSFAMRLTDGPTRAARRARRGSMLALLLAAVVWVLAAREDAMGILGAGSACVLSAALTVDWMRRAARAHRLRAAIAAVGLLAVPLGAGLALRDARWLELLAAAPAAALVALPTRAARLVHDEGEWSRVLLEHPARLAVSTFAALALLGTLLLALPQATADDQAHSLIDAAFTATSAVCVTGLIVLDTPRDFGPFGQGCLLLLIQVGGLGIMSLSTVVLHALGRRMSLRQEQAVADVSVEERQRLRASLRRMVAYAFALEAVGAALLLPQFLAAGDGFGAAAWRAFFTSISAFCNAGFALQSDSLVPYAQHPGILHVVAALVVLGGISPAVVVLVPRWVRGRSVPPHVALVVGTTLLLLVGGTVLTAAFEWRGLLAGRPLPERLHHAWFQSVTLRTAGFNALPLESMGTPEYLLSLVLMAIGGSPGGTAGGIKTTTFAVLALGLLAAVRGRDAFVLRGRRISHRVILRAFAVAGTGALVWSLAVLALVLTQEATTRELVFEATSAIGTVGLTLGATAKLDAVGKAIIIVVMFVGRVGPLTMLTLLEEQELSRAPRRPDAVVPIS